MKNPVLKQGIENLILVVRQNIRQVHSLRARNELNEELDARRQAYWLCAQTGADLNEYMEGVLKELLRRILNEMIVEQKRAETIDARRALPPGQSKKAIK